MNTSQGFFRLYAFLIVSVLTVAYAAYYFGNIGVQKPIETKKENQKYYTETKGGVYKYGSDPADNTEPELPPSPYPDSPSNFKGAYSSAYDPAANPVANPSANLATNPAQNNQPLGQPAAQQTGQQNQQGILGTDGNLTTAVSASTTVTSPITPPTPTGTSTGIGAVTSSVVSELFTSTINKKISFLVPTGSVVKENGTTDKISFTINTPDKINLILNYSKDNTGCEDAIYSFPITSSEGVDYRIIHEQKETSIKSTYRIFRAYEEYGTYSGKLGIRANACIFTAIPTRIEIRSASYGRKDIQSGFNLMGDIIYNLKV